MPVAGVLHRSGSSVLREGFQGEEVKELQRLLNSKISSSSPLVADGQFGWRTTEEVKRFQREHWLVTDGIVGPCTWAALLDREEYVILHPVQLVPQHTSTTCWSASIAMIKGQLACMHQGPALLLPDGSMANDTGPTHGNIAAYARYQGLVCEPPRTWSARGIAGLLKSSGPLAIHLLWNLNEYLKGEETEGHFAVIAGIRGDGTESGSTVRIYDPWPPNRGNICSVNYARLMNRLPGLTFNIVHR